MVETAGGITDPTAYRQAVARCRELAIVLPTFAELADPSSLDVQLLSQLIGIDPDAPDPRNLYRVHWYNGADRRSLVPVPSHLVLPPELTGVPATIVVALADRFPMIGAHKVLAAYACLAPRLVSGGFDPTSQRAVWPSTGNFCRGGVAISRMLGCRGVAVLPEDMSTERFEWLRRWVAEPSDVITTPGGESNVREIYERCQELAEDERNVILNQFAEYPNYVVHRLCTGRALERLVEHLRVQRPQLQPFAFVATTGSSGSLGAGDHLKQRLGTRTVAAEPVECATMLRNGFGDHNIQGIGDKHIPLIHNVMNTDVVVAVSDRNTDRLDAIFHTKEGLAALQQAPGLEQSLLAGMAHFGLSALANVVAAVAVARHFELGPEDLVLTLATDGAAMYADQRQARVRRDFPEGLDEPAALAALARDLQDAEHSELLELRHQDRTRIFNLGYFTWVEQQGVSLEAFEVRRRQAFWDGLMEQVGAWDELIAEFNAQVGAPATA
ncbi:MAG: pyridoxal-phosphate dependent enzyme [Candidatus Dormibacteria bacterium]|jgi:cysteine synthase